jgi:pimeloyl-ACP methyl ester carboxylesterase
VDGVRREVRAACDGATIAYTDAGEGPAVLFLHGFPHDRTLWDGQLAAFAPRARCLAPDLRGFGASDAAGPFTMDCYADDAACVLDAAGVASAVVVGLSMGGYVAFALWRRHRHRVRALVLVSTRANADDDATRAKRDAVMDLARREGSAAVAAGQLPGALAAATRRERPDLVRAVTELQSRAPVAGIVGALEAMLARPDSTPDLPTISVPTVVIAGADDALIRTSVARGMQAAIPGSALVVLEGAGHLCNLERPAEFDATLEEFLTRVAPA